MITVQEINKTYEQLVEKTRIYHECALDEISMKTRLDRAVLAGYADGTISGKNENVRLAVARATYPTLYESHEMAERNAVLAKNELDLARLEVERVRALIRLAELTAGVGV